MNIFQEAHVKLQPDKTKLYVYENTTIRYFDSAKENDEKEPALTYLGFRFDGKSIFAKQRSVYKFYRGARKFIWRAKNIQYEKLHDIIASTTHQSSLHGLARICFIMGLWPNG